MLTERFQLIDEQGNILISKKKMERLFLWLADNEFFVKNSNIVLQLREETTKVFCMEINKETTIQEAQDAWKKFNGYI